MRRITTVPTCLLLLAWAPYASADFSTEYFDRMLEKDVERLRNVDDLLVQKEALGWSRLEYYEKTSSVDVDGETFYILNHVPPTEIQARYSQSELANMSPGQLEAAADQVEMAGRNAEIGVQQEISQSGFPPHLANMFMNAGDDPRTPQDEDQLWLSANPTDTTRMMGMMLRGAAEGKRLEAQMDQEERDAYNERRQLASLLDFAGEMSFNGRNANKFVRNDLNWTQTSEDGTTATWNSLEFIGDAEQHVPLKMTIEGTIDDGNETRQVKIEREERDYRTVPGCGDMYRPFETVMRISGIMTPEEEAQMAEAQAQMADFEKQMAGMPKAQRDMIMRQMGPQIEMMRNMSAGGGIELVEKVVDMRCNVGMPTPLQIAQVTMGGGMMGGAGVLPDAVRPYYVDEQGVGVIRYSDPGGASGEYFLDVVQVSGDQVLAGGLGPYTGKDIGIFIGSLKMMPAPMQDLELELYQQNPRRTAVRFRPEVDPDRAESKQDCGSISSTGQCSN